MTPQTERPGAPRRTILLLSGPNLNLLGTRARDLRDHHARRARRSSVRRSGRSRLRAGPLRANHEGVLVDAVHEAHAGAAAIVVNAGAFTHYSWALHDALAAFDGPVVELHLSNPASREPWRQTSVIAPVADALISGLGGAGYRMAVEAAVELLDVPLRVPDEPGRAGVSVRQRVGGRVAVALAALVVVVLVVPDRAPGGELPLDRPGRDRAAAGVTLAAVGTGRRRVRARRASAPPHGPARLGWRRRGGPSWCSGADAPSDAGRTPGGGRGAASPAHPEPLVREPRPARTARAVMARYVDVVVLVEYTPAHAGAFLDAGALDRIAPLGEPGSSVAGLAVLSRFPFGDSLGSSSGAAPCAGARRRRPTVR